MKLYLAADDYDEQTAKVFAPQNVVQSVAIASDESFFLSSGNNGLVTFWNPDTLANSSFLRPASNPQVIYEVLMSKNDQYIVGAGNTQAFSWQRATPTTATWDENPAIASGL